jgi:SAM-dependent methyltransferase
MKEIFEKIYFENQWKDSYGTSSGPGSAIECSYQYLLFLNQFIQENSIKSILDLGCGDFNLMKHFNLNDIDYLGIDLVTNVINNNNKYHSKYNIKFEQNDIIEYKSDKSFDLVIVKDVLQHLSNNNIKKIVNNINYSKRIILINDFTDTNVDSINGGYRPLNLNKSPFNINCNKIFEFDSCGFIKHVNLLICG